jgi:hypothetical protein
MFNEGADMMKMEEITAAFARGSEVMLEASTAMEKFGAVLEQKTKPSPKKGELFKLSEALKPSVITLEVCKALGLRNPPVLLTYTGNETGAEVRTQFVL